MDVPNVPNPTNPNAQEQFMDAVQGPANQAQGPAAQNQAQGPAAQGPVNNKCPSWSKCTHSASTTTGPSTSSPCWSGGACPSGILSKLDRKET